jgi:hypothetical protein
MAFQLQRRARRADGPALIAFFPAHPARPASV